MKQEQKKSLLILGLFAIGFLITELGFYYTPSNIIREYSQFITSEDGIKVCYDVYEPRKEDSFVGQKNAVIMGHGIMVNKNVFRLMAIELAKSGFVVVAFDYRSHGWTGGDFNGPALGFFGSFIDIDTGLGDFSEGLRDMTHELQAAKSYLASRNDINMQNLGYVGYSMGGGIGFLQLSNDDDFRAMVGIAPLPVPTVTNVTNPANLLIIVGKYDEAIPFDGLFAVMEKKTGINAGDIQYGQVYGSFEEGTAAMIYLDPYMEHFLAPFDLDFIRETRNWLIRALTGSSDFTLAFEYPFSIAWICMQIFTALGLFAMLSQQALKGVQKPTKNVERDVLCISQPLLDKYDKPMIIKKTMIYVICLSHLGMVFILPLYLTPMVFTAFETMFFLGPSMALFFFLRKRYKEFNISQKDYYSDLIKKSNLRNMGIGLGLATILYGLLELSFGNLLNLMPSAQKWVWTPLFMGVLVFIYLNYIGFFQPIMMRKTVKDFTDRKAVFKMAVENTVFNLLVALFVLLTPSLLMRNYFILMFFIPVSIILTISSFIGTYYYTQTNDILLSSLVNAIFVGGFYAAMGPMVSIFTIIAGL